MPVFLTTMEADAPLQPVEGEDQEGEKVGVEVPPYFLCPISLQLMADPVTLPTGITYDRDCIEEWLFSSTHATGRNPNHHPSTEQQPICPVTKQPLTIPLQVTPNTTLRHLIHSWCSSHPRLLPPAPDTSLLLREAPSSLPSLRRLRELASDSDSACRSLVRAGAAGAMLGILRDPSSCPAGREESLAILHSLRLPENSLRDLVDTDPDVIGFLTCALHESIRQGRAHAVALLHACVRATGVGALGEEVFAEVARVVRDGVSHRATKAALRLLREALPVGRNRVRAAEAGTVGVLVELLLEGPENRVVEMALALLELLCGCAEGREALTSHAAGMAVVAQAVMTVSEAASEKAVRVLWWVSRHASGTVVEEMVQVGAVSKLFYCSRVGRRVAEKAREALKMHARAWGSWPCVPQGLLLSLARVG